MGEWKVEKKERDRERREGRREGKGGIQTFPSSHDLVSFLSFSSPSPRRRRRGESGAEGEREGGRREERT